MAALIHPSGARLLPPGLTELLESRANVERQLLEGKAILSAINDAIDQVVRPYVAEAFKREGKASGTVRFMIGNRSYKAEVTAKSEYDGEAIAKIAATVPYEVAKDLFKIEFSVIAKAVQNLADGTDLKNQIIAAKTTKYSNPKITAADH